MEAIKKMFAPEFRNRLDAVVQFEPLDDSLHAILGYLLGGSGKT